MLTKNSENLLFLDIRNDKKVTNFNNFPYLHEYPTLTSPFINPKISQNIDFLDIIHLLKYD